MTASEAWDAAVKRGQAAREAQGLPPVLEDPETCALIARIVVAQESEASQE